MQNKHLNHFEDTLLIYGNEGIEKIIHYARCILGWLSGSKDAIRITIKYDGSPSVFFGVHPIEKKIFVSTKSLLNKKSLYACTHEEISQFNPGIHDTLSSVLDTIKKIPKVTGIWQGDILYTPHSLEVEKDYFVFRHNTLAYNVLQNSEMGYAVNNAPLGLVVHTHYTYKNGMYEAGFGKSFTTNSSSIWQPPLEAFKDMYPTTALEQILDTIVLRSKDLFDFYAIIAERFSNPKKWQSEILKAINYHITHKLDVSDVNALWKHIHMTMWHEYSSKSSFDSTDPKNGCAQIDALEKKHSNDIKKWLTWYVDIMKLKKDIITILQTMVDHSALSLTLDGQPSHHEGFVVSDINNTWVVKLVQREVFSQANFTLPKNWK